MALQDYFKAPNNKSTPIVAIDAPTVDLVKAGKILTEEDILAHSYLSLQKKGGLAGATSKIIDIVNNPDLDVHNELIKAQQNQHPYLGIPSNAPMVEDSYQFQFDEAKRHRELADVFNSSERPSLMSYDTLRQVSTRSSLVSSIIRTRVSQMSLFASPQPDRYSSGFKIMLKDALASPTIADQNEMAALTDFILNLGWGPYNNERKDFNHFMRQTVNDSYTFDQINFEKIYSRDGKPFAWKACDPACIRPRWNALTKKWQYAEIQDGVEQRRYTARNMAFETRNPTTDRLFFGYGVSEIELIIHIISAHLFTEEYNKRIFKQGHNLSGLINLKGQVSKQQMQEFKRDFYGMVGGMENMHKVMVTNAPQGLEFNNSIKTPSEMGFGDWMDYLTKVGCAIFLIDPFEINFFTQGNSGQKASPMSSSENERFIQSQKRGLFPMLGFYERMMQRHFLSYHPKYSFKFVGYSTVSLKEELDLYVKMLQYKTVNEIRAMEDLKPFSGPKGETTANQYYNQMLQAEAASNASSPDDKSPEAMGPSSAPNIESAPNQAATKKPSSAPSPEESALLKKQLSKMDISNEDRNYVLELYNAGQISREDLQPYFDLTVPS